MDGGEIEKLTRDFLTVAEIAGVPLQLADIDVENLPPPHKPSALPAGKQAVYVFCYMGETLKVGKAGPKSNARYHSQHYNPKSAGSTLAQSILNHPEHCPDFIGLNEKTVGEWIKKNTQRINFRLDGNLGVNILSLMEAFILCRLNPAFEGHASQRR